MIKELINHEIQRLDRDKEGKAKKTNLQNLPQSMNYNFNGGIIDYNENGRNSSLKKAIWENHGDKQQDIIQKSKEIKANEARIKDLEN